MNKTIYWNNINLKKEETKENKQYDDSRFIKLLQDLEQVKVNQKREIP